MRRTGDSPPEHYTAGRDRPRHLTRRPDLVTDDFARQTPINALVNGVASFQIIEERLNRHPGASKYGGPTHHIGVAGAYRFSHVISLLPTLRPVQLEV
jgi:hypothetical protein